MKAMARKKKIKRFGAVQAVKELARERMGAPPAEKVVPHKNKKPDKHKPTLGKLLGALANSRNGRRPHDCRSARWIAGITVDGRYDVPSAADARRHRHT